MIILSSEGIWQTPRRYRKASRRKLEGQTRRGMSLIERKEINVTLNQTEGIQRERERERESHKICWYIWINIELSWLLANTNVCACHFSSWSFLNCLCIRVYTITKCQFLHIWDYPEFCFVLQLYIHVQYIHW